MRVHAVWLLLVAACGSVSDTPKDAPPGDIGRDTTTADGPVDGPPALGMFGAPVLLSVLSTASSDSDPSMTADGLELFFASTRPGGMGGSDIYVSTRATTTAAWGAPVIVTAVNSAMNEQHAEISADGLSMYLVSNRGTTFDVYVTVRATRTAPWSTPTVVTELSSATASEARFGTTASGLVGLLDSDRAGGTTGRDMYLTTRSSTTAAWSVPVIIPELATANVFNGSLSGDGLTIYCADGADLLVAHRATTASSFGTPVALTELNTSSSDTDPWISGDEKTIIFTSSRGGTQDLYMATR